jgi:sorting nexin-1/2
MLFLSCPQWFEEKQAQVDTLDQQLKKLHHNVELLVMNRKGK